MLLVEIVFAVDLILPFFTEFILEDGKIEKDIYEIAARNIRSGTFIFDVIAIIPIRQILQLVL